MNQKVSCSLAEFQFTITETIILRILWVKISKMLTIFNEIN